MEWNWSGNGLENCFLNLLELKLHGMEWNFHRIGNRCKMDGNRMELEWKWNGNKWPHRHGSKIKWNGMETERKWNGEIMTNNDISIWFWKWNGMEMEMEWNSRLIIWNFQMEKFRHFGKFYTIPFHSIPFDSMEFPFPFENGDLWCVLVASYLEPPSSIE